MRRLGYAGLAAVLVILAACSSDPITPSDGKVPGTIAPPPQAVGAVACSAGDIEAHLTALMSSLVPNDNSTLGKFQYVQTLMAYNDADSTAKARAFAQDPLLSFIHLKFSQASPQEQGELADDVEQVEAEILCFVGLFQIPTSNSPKVVVTPNQLMGVWFPDGFCDDDCPGINVALDILTACTAPGVPEGCTPAPLGTLLDTYGNFLRVTLSGGTPDWGTPDAPIVGICAPSELGDISLLGLRVGHQADGTSNTEGFTILDLVGLPPELDAELICETFASNDIPGAKAGTMFARMVNGLADLLLPEQAFANRMFLGGFGIGGTTRTFSPFGLVSTTLSATGIGGTKSSFSPANPDAPATAAPALATDANGNLIDSVFHKQVAQLPGVSVKTGQGTAIPGATVTFTMTDPETEPYSETPSSASVCDVAGANQTQIVATTDQNGFAALGCVNFGGTVGFKNLQATIDPSTAEGIAGEELDDITVRACDDDSCGTPQSTPTLNWLVTTTPGVAAKLTLESMATTAAAGTAFSPQPILNVRDQFNNVVLTNSVVVTATATPPASGTGGLINSSTPTSVNGVVTFSNLGIGGTAGVWNVAFSSAGLTGANANVTVTAGAAATVKTLMPLATSAAAPIYTYTSGLTPGANASPAPRVIVHDTYGNRVGSTPLTWSPVLGSNGSVLTIGGAGSTGADGTAQVTSWAFGDGLSQLEARITALPTGDPAQFSATTPTGVAVFSCITGTTKRNLAPWSVVRPSSSVKEVTIWISVNGQSNLTEPYPAELRVYETEAAFISPTGVPSRIVSGSVLLPGNNGNPTAVTFSLPTALPRITGNNTLYFKLSLTIADPQRRPQVWSTSSTSGDCGKVQTYPSYPSLTPTLKGMRIQLTN